jgi:CubicO group peptidase (beta-lactamase class C family)
VRHAHATAIVSTFPSTLRGRIGVVLAIAAIAALGYGGYYLWQLAAIATGHAAKTLCSGVFVSGLDPQTVVTAELSPELHPAFRFVETRLDRAGQAARAALLGLREREARYRAGLGCALTYPDAPVPGQAPASVRPAAPATGEWPDGERVTAEPGPAWRAALDRAFAEPDGTPARRTRAVVIVHRGHIVAERYAAGVTSHTPLLGWSMTKSVMNALVGVLVQQGRLALDEPAPVPEWQAPGDARARITVGQLLHMSSGLAFEERYRSPLGDVTRMLLATPNMAAFVALKPLQFEPGAHYAYASGTTNLLARVLRETLGEARYPDFPRRALFAPLGMRSAVLETDASGTFVGSSYMYASARDWARFGLLYLHDGVWNGKRLLPAGWVAYSRTPAPADPQARFGAHFWVKLPKEYAGPDPARTLPADSFHAVGHEGQFVTVIPAHDLVIVRLGLTRVAGAWDHTDFVERVLAALQTRAGSAR